MSRVIIVFPDQSGISTTCGDLNPTRWAVWSHVVGFFSCFSNFSVEGQYFKISVKIDLNVNISSQTRQWKRLNICLFFHSSRVGSRWQQAEQSISGAPLPRNDFQLLLGNLDAFPGQTSYIIPPVSPGSPWGSTPSWSYLEILRREAPRRRSNQMPNRPPQRLYTELPQDVYRSLWGWAQPPYGGNAFWSLCLLVGTHSRLKVRDGT